MRRRLFMKAAACAAITPMALATPLCKPLRHMWIGYEGCYNLHNPTGKNTVLGTKVECIPLSYAKYMIQSQTGTRYLLYLPLVDDYVKFTLISKESRTTQCSMMVHQRPMELGSTASQYGWRIPKVERIYMALNHWPQDADDQIKHFEEAYCD